VASYLTLILALREPTHGVGCYAGLDV